MNDKIVIALIGGFIATLVPALTYFLTKRQERSVAHHNLKLSQYQEFIDAVAGIVDGVSTEESQARFSRSTNTLYLIGSNEVLRAMIRFRGEIGVSNPNRSSEAHDRLLARLVWEIRKDLGDPPTKNPDDFEVRLWSSGPQTK